MESGTVWSEMTGTVWSEMGGTVWSVIATVDVACEKQHEFYLMLLLFLSLYLLCIFLSVFKARRHRQPVFDCVLASKLLMASRLSRLSKLKQSALQKIAAVLSYPRERCMGLVQRSQSNTN